MKRLNFQCISLFLALLLPLNQTLATSYKPEDKKLAIQEPMPFSTQAFMPRAAAGWAFLDRLPHLRYAQWAAMGLMAAFSGSPIAMADMDLDPNSPLHRAAKADLDLALSLEELTVQMKNKKRFPNFGALFKKMQDSLSADARDLLEGTLKRAAEDLQVLNAGIAINEDALTNHPFGCLLAASFSILEASRERRPISPHTQFQFSRAIRIYNGIEPQLQIQTPRMSASLLFAVSLSPPEHINPVRMHLLLDWIRSIPHLPRPWRDDTLLLCWFNQSMIGLKSSMDYSMAQELIDQAVRRVHEPMSTGLKKKFYAVGGGFLVAHPVSGNILAQEVPSNVKWEWMHEFRHNELLVQAPLTAIHFVSGVRPLRFRTKESFDRVALDPWSRKHRKDWQSILMLEAELPGNEVLRANLDSTTQSFRRMDLVKKDLQIASSALEQSALPLSFAREEPSTSLPIGILFPALSSLEGTLHAKTLLENSPAVAQLYERAANAAGLSESDLATKNNTRNDRGPLKILSVLLYSLAIWEAAQERNPFRPTLIAGNSIGLLSALVVSGAISVEDMVRFVKDITPITDDIAEKTDIGLLSFSQTYLKDIESILETGKVELIRDASPFLILLGVKAEDKSVVARVIEQAQKLASNAEHVHWAYPPPFSPRHASWYSAATDVVRAAAHRLLINKPQIPIVNSAERSGVIKTEFDVFHALENLFVTPIYWRDTLNRMSGKVKLFLEMGPSDRLTRLNRDMGIQVPTVPMNRLSSLYDLSRHLEKAA